MNKIDYAAAQSLSTQDIPLIDLQPLLEKGEIHTVSQDLLSAALNTGFFYVKGHGIDQEIIDDAFKATEEFFSTPEDHKAKVAVNTQQRGWLAPGMAKLEKSKTHDLKEIFFFGPEKWSEALLAKQSSIPLIAKNRWPDNLPGFKQKILTYYDAVRGLGHKLLSAIAMGLGEDKTFFAKRYTSPLARGQLVYYPRSSHEDEQQERFGAAAHTDFGVLTLLMQDDNGGLQILNKKQQWIEAPPIQGTFVCNIGDLLHRWTNDYLSSNLHRVINRSGNERFSMPIFFDPDPDVVIDSQDFEQFKHQPRKYPPVSVADYIDSKNRKNFAQYKR